MKLKDFFAVAMIVMGVARTLALAETYGAIEGHEPKAGVAANEEQLIALASHPQWINLLHFKQEILGYRSEADGPGFFLSENGKYSELDELKATIAGMYSPPDSKDPDSHPICRFPARFMWLSRALPLNSELIPKVTCAKFDRFFSNIAPRSATVVFSSYYLNNPSSAFGHSFIRVNKELVSKAGQKYSLLDYGINYAANAEQVDPLSYALKGIFGLYTGTFTQVPYYYKVREYNDFEARDLWEYDLNLTQEQVTLMTAHFWELGQTQFDYFYFTENCSYHVLTSLEVANPELDLTERNPWVVIPTDTIRTIVNTPGLVKSIQYRPSVRAQFLHRLSLLSAAELSAFKTLAGTGYMGTLPADLTPQQKASILDTATDHLDFSHPDKMIEASVEKEDPRQKILLERAGLGIVSAPLEVPMQGRELPHAGHGSRRAAWTHLIQKNGVHAERLQYRFALHDLLDRAIGYPDYAQIEMFAFTGVLEWKKEAQVTRFDLEDTALFRVMSLNPLEYFNRKPSWRVQLQGKRFRDQDCSSCFGFNMDGGAGWTLQAKSWLGSSALFAMGEGEISAAPRFTGRHFRLGIGPYLGLRHRFADNLSTLVSYRYRFRPLTLTHSDWTAEAELRWAPSTSFALSMRAQKGSVYDEVGLGFHYYY